MSLNSRPIRTHAGDPMLGDLAMIINDPNCTNTLLTNIFNLLVEIIDQGTTLWLKRTGFISIDHN